MRNKRAKKVSALVAFLLLLQALVSGLTFPARAQAGFLFINSYWGSEANPQRVYRGSSNVMLIASIRNDLGRDLLSVSGTIYLPAGIQSYDGKGEATSTGSTQRNGTTSYDVKAGEAFELGYLLNVLESALPSEYQCNVNLSYSFFDGLSYTTGSETITVRFTVSAFPTFTFEVVNVYWTSPTGYVLNASSGSRNLNLNILLRNLGENTIERIDGSLSLGDKFSPSQALASVSNVAAGDTFTLTFTGITVPVSTLPGDYTTLMKLNCSFRGYGNAVDISSYSIPVTVKVSEMPSPNLQVIRVSWQNSERTYSGARGVSLDVQIQNLGDYSVSDILAVVHLPVGFTDSYGSSVIKAASPAVIGYGDFATVTVGPIYVGSNVNPGVYYFQAAFTCVGSRDTSQLMLSQGFTLPVVVSGISFYLDVGSVEWVSGGQPAVALPGARNLGLSITLINRGEDTLSGLNASLEMPSGFRLMDTSSNVGSVPSASSFATTFYFNVSENVAPGQYTATLTLTFNANPSSGNSIVSTYVLIPFAVDDPSRFDSALSLTGAYWGRPGNPTPAYPGSRFVPLTVEFVNNGSYTVQGVDVELTPTGNFTLIIGRVGLATSLSRGSFSSTTFTVSIDPSTPPGTYTFSVTQRYLLEVYGAILFRTRNGTFQLEVFKPPVQPPYVNVLSTGWENGNPAYPGTENATFNIAIANEAPYSIGGLSAKLTLPDVFSEGNLNGLQAYLAGPVASWQTTTLAFRINIEWRAAPRSYAGRLSLSYTLLSGGDNLRVSEQSDITVTVNSVGGLEPVYSNWLGRSPGPGSAGATLLILVRNNEVPQMRGIYTTVRLPQGFLSAVTGGNEVNVTPAAFSSSVQVEDLVSLLSGQGFPTGGAAPAAQSQAARGDILAVRFQVNVENRTEIGHYNLEITFSFIDQWGCVQKTSVTTAFWLPGSTRTVDVIEGKSKLLIGSRASVIELFIKNNGSASIREVYVAIAGAPQGISVSSAIKYVPEIGPLQESNLTWLASVNPQSPYTGSLPILVAISFTDMLGYARNLNQTAIIYVEGIVEIRLMDTTISPETPHSGGSITLSTTILNLGTYKAKNVEAYIEGAALKPGVGNYTYVGDVEVGAQVPASLTATLRDVTGNRTIYLVLRYRDVFNEPVTLVFPMNITVSEKPPSTQPEAFAGLEDLYRLAPIIATTVFLLVSGFILFRMYQRTKQKNRG